MPLTPSFARCYVPEVRFLAKVAELADALDLGSSGSRRGGSSPPFRIQLLAAAIERFTHRHLELETQAMTLTAGTVSLPHPQVDQIGQDAMLIDTHFSLSVGHFKRRFRNQPE